MKQQLYYYFLAHAIQKAKSSHGHFPTKHIHEKCEKLTTALSSLLLSYDEAHGVVSKTMHPELSQSKYYVTLRDLCGGGRVQADGGAQDDTDSQEYSYVFELYGSTMGEELPIFHEKCRNWLESTYKASNGGLSQLQEERLLGHEQCVMDTVLCCMLRSVTSIQLDCDSTIVASPNFYLTAYMHVVLTICAVCSWAKFDLRDCILGLAYYQHSLQQQKIDTQPLYDNIIIKAKKLENLGEIRADSGVLVSKYISSYSYKSSLHAVEKSDFWNPIYSLI